MTMAFTRVQCFLSISEGAFMKMNVEFWRLFNGSTNIISREKE